MKLPPLVLLYHSIADVSRHDDPHLLAVPPDRFRSQVAVVVSRGYRFVKATEFATRLRAGERLDGLCALTFDDGIADNAEILPPILENLDVAATLFVCGGLLGGEHPDYPAEAKVRIMSASRLRELAAHRLIEIGSHTDMHHELGDATEQTAYRVMSESRRTLEELTNKPVGTLAYPRGSYSPGCPSAAERAGYDAAFTCGPDRGAWRPYEIPRIIVESWDRRPSFEAKIRGLFYPAMSSRLGRGARGVVRSIRTRAAGPSKD